MRRGKTRNGVKFNGNGDRGEKSSPEEPPKPVTVSDYTSRQMWDSKFSAKSRSLFSAMSRMHLSSQGQMWTATFRKSGSSGTDDPDAVDGTSSTSFTLRFEVTRSLVSVQEEVGKHFGWQ
jgi:hypothetical protein